MTIAKQSLTELKIDYTTPDNTGGLPILKYWVKVFNGVNLDIEIATVDNGLALSFAYPVTQPGNEGKNFRLKVAAENLLGIGPYSVGTGLMAVDSPLAPTIVVDESSRTLTSINLKFVPNADSGGSHITGYMLWRDQGVAGSPFTLIYNGTGAPEIIFYNVTDLMTGHYYNFKLYSMNVIYQSTLFGTATVLIATVPSQPKKPEFVSAGVASQSITVIIEEPSYIGGIPITRYDLWIDNGAGVWPGSAT